MFYDRIKAMLKKNEKKKTIRQFQKHSEDTGSVEVQIGLLTKEIENLSNHLKKNPKDNSARRGLLFVVNKRKKLLKYLESKNETEVLKRVKEKIKTK